MVIDFLPKTGGVHRTLVIAKGLKKCSDFFIAMLATLLLDCDLSR